MARARYRRDSEAPIGRCRRPQAISDGIPGAAGSRLFAPDHQPVQWESGAASNKFRNPSQSLSGTQIARRVPGPKTSGANRRKFLVWPAKLVAPQNSLDFIKDRIRDSKMDGTIFRHLKDMPRIARKVQGRNDDIGIGGDAQHVFIWRARNVQQKSPRPRP